LLANDGLAHLPGDAPVAVVEAFDGGQIALDTRPAFGGFGSGRGDDRLGLDEGSLVLAGQPVPAAAQTASAAWHLDHQTTVLTLDGNRLIVGFVHVVELEGCVQSEKFVCPGASSAVQGKRLNPPSPSYRLRRHRSR